jgi:hypothetical protein
VFNDAPRLLARLHSPVVDDHELKECYIGIDDIVKIVEVVSVSCGVVAKIRAAAALEHKSGMMVFAESALNSSRDAHGTTYSHARHLHTLYSFPLNSSMPSIANE